MYAYTTTTKKDSLRPSMYAHLRTYMHVCTSTHMHAYTPTTKKDILSHGGKALHNISPPSRACQRSVWVCEGGGSSAYGTQLPASICLDLGFRFRV
jgi:hypothetical protein